MRVLFVFGGIPHYTVPLLEKIAHCEVDVVVLLPETRSSVIGEGVKLSEESNIYKIVCSEEKKSKWSKKRYFPGLKNVIITEKPDIIVVGWPYFLQFFFDRSILSLVRRKNIRLIFREIPFQTPPFCKLFSYFRQHPAYNEDMVLVSKGLGFYIRNFVMMFIRKFLYKHVDATLNYASLANEILPSYGVPKEKIFITYNATDAESIWNVMDEIKHTPLLLSPNKRRIIHIGRLVKWKRVDLLIQSFSKLTPRFSDIELLIIGDGPEKEHLKSMACDLGIGNHVIFTGPVFEPFLLGKYMSESSIYVLAGMGGLSINDAMAYSLPVICSVCDGTEKDLVQDGYNGLFFKEGDNHSLYEKLLLLLSNEELRKTMGKNAQNTIINNINLDVVTARFLEAFNYVMK